MRRFSQVKRFVLFLVFFFPLVWLVSRNSNITCAGGHDESTGRSIEKEADTHKKGSTRLAPYLLSIEGEQITQESREFFKGSLLWGKTRKEVYLTIGIPCIARPRNDRYIIKTLNSLLKHSSEADRENMVFAIFLADFNDTLRTSTGRILLDKYKEHVDSGLIQMFKAPKKFYPTLENLKLTYDEPLTMVKWRAKQNFDYAYIMLYSQNLSTYYLQLEDDVITVSNYFTIIKDFITEKNKGHWVCLEFCSLGFIAKLYHSFDLEKLARLLMLFYNEQPNDVTYTYFNNMMLQKDRIIRKPTIFDHRGIHSSLVMKMNSLKDPLFKGDPNETEDNAEDEKVDKHYGVKQPPGKAYATFPKYEIYTADAFYQGAESIFWGLAPRKGDTFTAVFDTPLHISDISMTTGSTFYPNDKLQHGELRIGRTGGAAASRLSCSDIVRSAPLTDGHVKIENIPTELAVACIQLVATEKQNTWMMISELRINLHQT